MQYYIRDIKITLSDIIERITESDLVPSRRVLLEDIKSNFEKIGGKGIVTLKELRAILKIHARIITFGTEIDVEAEYLIILRREIESWFPKAFSVLEFSLLSAKESELLLAAGLYNTKKVYDVFSSPKKTSDIMEIYNIDRGLVDKIFNLSDLTRIQWTSPNAAEMYTKGGYDTVRKIAEADAEKFSETINRINEEGRFYKGKIGLRDYKRVILSARYLLTWSR